MEDTTNPGPREAVPGDNSPPPDTEILQDRLEADYAILVNAAADIEVRAFSLPTEPKTDEECALLISYAADAKRVIKTAENGHTEEKAPHLALGRTVDGFFKSLWSPLQARVESVEGRINAYNRAKAAREAAERAEKARLEREAAEAARRAQEAAARAAEKARQEEEAAAAKLRAAASEKARLEAAEQMREAAQASEAARADEKEAGAAAVASERVAESHERAASGSVAQLGKVTATGASAAVTTFWNHSITDAAKLMETLGPLGPYLSNDAIIQAIGALKRELGKGDKLAEFNLPGVNFFKDSRTNVRQAR